MNVEQPYICCIHQHPCKHWAYEISDLFSIGCKASCTWTRMNLYPMCYPTWFPMCTLLIYIAGAKTYDIWLARLGSLHIDIHKCFRWGSSSTSRTSRRLIKTRHVGGASLHLHVPRMARGRHGGHRTRVGHSPRPVRSMRLTWNWSRVLLRWIFVQAKSFLSKSNSVELAIKFLQG